MAAELEAAIIDAVVPRKFHDRRLLLPVGWDFRNLSKLSSGWGKLGTGDFQRIEWRGALWRDGHSSGVQVDMRHGQYWAFIVGQGWVKQFDVEPEGAFLGDPAATDDPYVDGRGVANFRRTADGFDTITWPANKSRLLHFWAGKRHPVQAGQVAELATVQVRVLGPDPVIAGIGTDYYRDAAHNSHRAPGAGIARHRELPPGEWVTLAWLTVNEIEPHDVSAVTLADWMGRNGLPQTTESAPMPPPIPESGEIELQTVDMAVTARGTTGSEVIIVGDSEIELDASDWTHIVEGVPVDELSVFFVNDGRDPATGGDRNVVITDVEFYDPDSDDLPVTITPDDPRVQCSGVWSSTQKRCVTGMGLGSWIHCNGWHAYSAAFADEMAKLAPEPEPEPEATPCPSFTDEDFREHARAQGWQRTLELLLEALDA